MLWETISAGPAGMEVYNMGKRILVAVICVPILFFVMFFLPPVVMTVLFAAVSAMAAHEFFRAVGEGKLTLAMKLPALVSSAAIPVAVWLGFGGMAIGVCAFVVMCISFWCAIRSYGEEEAGIGFYHVMLTLFGGVVIPAGLSALVALKCMEQGKYLVLLAVMLAFITDGGAYFVGMFLGKHRGITKVSPKKSLEGYIGGFVTGVAAALLFGAVVQAASGLAVNYLSLALAGLVGAVVTELGDLAFSLIKRQYGVKDYGNLLPGHGGMLDRFDSMVFCAPAVLFVVTVLPVF